jgi:hypothetical protein
MRAIVCSGGAGGRSGGARQVRARERERAQRPCCVFVGPSAPVGWGRGAALLVLLLLSTLPSVGEAPRPASRPQPRSPGAGAGRSGDGGGLRRESPPVDDNEGAGCSRAVSPRPLAHLHADADADETGAVRPPHQRAHPSPLLPSLPPYLFPPPRLVRSSQLLHFRMNLFKLREDREMKPQTFAHMLSQILYAKR